MNQAGAAAKPGPFAAQPDVTATLRHGLERVNELSGKLQALDDMMLAGLPLQIAETAAAVEAALQTASPAFSDITAVIGQLGAANLAVAAAQLRDADQSDAAGLAEALRLALKRFARRSVEANRRAQHLSRGLNTALRSLQALGVEDSGRLIAEA